MVMPPPSRSYAHNRICGHFSPSPRHQSHQTRRNEAMLEGGTRRRETPLSRQDLPVADVGWRMWHDRFGSINGRYQLEMRRPLFPRKQTWIGPARAGKLGEFQRFSPGGLFGLSFNFLRMNQDHRSASSSRQRIDHPPPRKSDDAPSSG
jgi:hypothetical protein